MLTKVYIKHLLEDYLIHLILLLQALAENIGIKFLFRKSLNIVIKISYYVTE